MVSKKINKVTIYEVFYLSNARIDFNIFKAFSFADINIIYQRIFFFPCFLFR